MHKHSHSNNIKVSQNKHTKSSYQKKPNVQYEGADKSDDDDDLIIAYQMCAQPQKTVSSPKVSKSYTKKCLYASIPYRLQPYHKHKKYLSVQLNTCADDNLMPESVYKLVFNNPDTTQLAKNDTDLTVYTKHSVDLICKCTSFMLSKHTKQRIEIDYYIAKDDGSVLSHETVFQLQLLDVQPRLEYLPSRVSLISSAAEYHKKEVHAQSRSIKQQHNTEVAHSRFILDNSRPIIV